MNGDQRMHHHAGHPLSTLRVTRFNSDRRLACREFPGQWHLLAVGKSASRAAYFVERLRGFFARDYAFGNVGPTTYALYTGGAEDALPPLPPGEQLPLPKPAAPAAMEPDPCECQTAAPLTPEEVELVLRLVRNHRPVAIIRHLAVIAGGGHPEAKPRAVNILEWLQEGDGQEIPFTIS